MRVQKQFRIYKLGSLLPFLFVFAGDMEGVEHMQVERARVGGILGKE